MYKFLDVKDRETFNRVREYFKHNIEVLYGNQDSALQKIKQGTDRKCLILNKLDQDVGLLVFKIKPNNEYGLRKAFEIKTLFIIDPEKNSGKKNATRLLLKVCLEALKQKSKSIFVTASSERPEVIHFFLKRGFLIKGSFPNHYKEGSSELLLVHNSLLQLFLSLSVKLLLFSLPNLHRLSILHNQASHQ